MANLVEALEAEQREKLSTGKEERLQPGDLVRVHLLIVEGRRERVQVFEGTIIAIRGSGTNKTITVRRTGAHGVGVERIFPVYSPRVEKVEVVRHSKVRRSKLYYLRNLTGKKARLRQRFIKSGESDE